MTSHDHRPLSARDILTSIGEVVYEWDIASDAVRWGANVTDVLGLEGIEPVATGARYAALLAEPADEGWRAAIASSPNTDEGRGTPYRIEYALKPRGEAGPTLRIDDSGRWFADMRGKPERAHGVIRLVDERQDALRRLAGEPSFDPLTRQLGRNHLLAALRASVGTLVGGRKQAAFMITAIEGLAEINEAMGVSVGDNVIAEVGSRIRSQLRAGDVIGRYSGAAFGILVMNCGDKAMAIAAERFAAAVRNAGFEVARPVGPLLSIGGVLIPRQARTAEEAMLAAEQALRSARKERPGGFRAFTTEHRIGARPLQTARTLAVALDERTVSFELEPIRMAAGGGLAGHRATPFVKESDGRITADEYRAVADRFGLSSRHDILVLERIAADLGAAADLVVSVPLSAAAMIDPGWLKLATRLLGRRPEDAARLTIEIEAGVASRHAAAAEVFASELRRLGIDVALSGFGIDPIGPDLVRRLAPARIDLAAYLVSTFAEGLEDARFLDALVRLAKASGAAVLAPAPEAPALTARLAAIGIIYLRRDVGGVPTPIARHAIEARFADDDESLS